MNCAGDCYEKLSRRGINESLVTSDATVGGIIGTRLEPVNLNQATALPAMTYQEIAGPEDVTTDGPLGLVDSRWQFNCWAVKHSDCVTLRDAVKSLFRQNYSGTVQGVTIQGTHIVGRGDIDALNQENEELTRYGKYLDVVISYNED
jgi:hypothetical protein